MLNFFKKESKTHKIKIEIINYYEKIGWEIDKYFVLKVEKFKKRNNPENFSKKFVKNAIKIIILTNDLIHRMPQNIFLINEINAQIKETESTNINEKNINIDLLAQLLTRYYVVLPYLYIFQCSKEYLESPEKYSIEKLVKKLTNKNLRKIVDKSPKILDIWKCIKDDQELFNKFDPIFNEIFDKYIKFN